MTKNSSYSEINSIENIDNLSEREIINLKNKRNRKIIGTIIFFGILCVVFYFILKVIFVIIFIKIIPAVTKTPSGLNDTFFEIAPLITLISIALLTLYLRVNKIVKDIISKKKKIVKAKVEDKIKSQENYHKIRHPEIKAMVSTFNSDNYSYRNTKNSSNLFYHHYLIIDNIYFKVTPENFNKFEVDEQVNIHFGYYSDLPVLIQSMDDENKKIEVLIPSIYDEKTKVKKILKVIILGLIRLLLYKYFSI